MNCELILGSIVLPAILLNESTKGFGVLASGMPHVACGQKAQLHNYDGWFDCQIVYAAEVLPGTTAIYRAAGVYDEVKCPTDEEDEELGNKQMGHITAYDIDRFTGHTKGPWFRLGIRCLRKLNVPAAANALPVTSDSGLLQSIKGVFTAIFTR
jgi:hypothetical protein